jgi:caa(3)-type oxidase subunit IV
MTTEQPTLRTYFVIYGLLMLGLVLTIGASYVPLGRLNLAVAMAIAFAKAALVVMYFMHVLYSPKLTWLAVFAGLVWLAILLALVGADYATRSWIPVEPPAGAFEVTCGPVFGGAHANFQLDACALMPA